MQGMLVGFAFRSLAVCLECKWKSWGFMRLE